MVDLLFSEGIFFSGDYGFFHEYPHGLGSNPPGNARLCPNKFEFIEMG